MRWSACFPVYRTYVSAAGHHRQRPAYHRQRPGAHAAPASDHGAVDLRLRAQRPAARSGAPPTTTDACTSPCASSSTPARSQAKGREDTAFYRYLPLAALNEVGGDPERFGCSPAELHAANLARRAAWPHAMLATATHDTKRGEDARARLDGALRAERGVGPPPVGLGARHRRPPHHRRRRAGARSHRRVSLLPGAARRLAAGAPRRRTPSWPSGWSRPHVKAAREAKRHTSWLTENAAYEAALGAFIRGVLGGRAAGRFLPLFLPFQARVAALGTVNSLAQMVLKCVVPGVPDFYQGTELWDLSLVDPDNRRPVDYGLRERLLADLDAAPAGTTGRAALADALLRAWTDGRIKLLITTLLLRLRRERATLFRDGDYAPLETRGHHAGHAVALARRDGAHAVVAVVPRLCAALTSAERPFPLGGCWENTDVALPDHLAGRRLRDVLTGAEHPAGAALALAQVLSVLPVAVLAG